jgi:hypothetical protein
MYAKSQNGYTVVQYYFVGHVRIAFRPKINISIYICYILIYTYVLWSLRKLKMVAIFSKMAVSR